MGSVSVSSCIIMLYVCVLCAFLCFGCGGVGGVGGEWVGGLHQGRERWGGVMSV